MLQYHEEAVPGSFLMAPPQLFASPRSALISACVVAALAGFLLPWARLDFNFGSGLEKSISRSLKSSSRKAFGTGKRASKRAAKGTPAIPTVVRGYQIPVLANRKNAKVAMQLVKLFTKKDEHAGLKSWLVYLVPGLAALSGWLLLTRPRDRAGAIAALAVCAAVAGGGFYVLATTDTRKEFAVVVSEGLWISLIAHAGLAMLAAQTLASRKPVC